LGYTSEGSNQSATHQDGRNNVLLPKALPAWTGHSAAQPSVPLQFTVNLWPVSAAHLSGTSLLTADTTKQHEPLHYTVASCPVLHHTTPALSLPALSSMVAEPAINQFSQQAHLHLAAPLQKGPLTNSQMHF